MSGISGSLTPLFDKLDAIAEPGQYVSGAVVEIRAELEKTTSAHTTPKGEPWSELKGGGKAYVGVMKYIDVRQVSPTQAIIELKGPPVFGQYGTGKMDKREIIPTEIDEKLGNAIRRGVVTVGRRRSK
jgi:hypothetical protein